MVKLKNKNLYKFFKIINIMSRVKWKGPYIKYSLLININKLKYKHNNILTVSRNSIILPKFIGSIVQVYNGKIFVPLKISEEIIGYKLGEFVPTRKLFFHKKKKVYKK